MSLLDALHKGGHLRTLDHALAQSLRRLDRDTPDAVLAAAALASLAVAKGHAGVRLGAADGLVEAEIAWPDAAAWTRQLAASRWVDTPDDASAVADPHAPLVLEGGLLYLRRYREYERALALGLQRIATQPVPEAGIEPLALLFARLFPQATHDDRQARAAALALRHALLLVTGGPGTGKTTTTARLLVLLVAQALHAGRASPRIALAAPTGRAAERMAESVRQAVQALAASGVDADLLAALPTSGTTLHRLLGTIPDSPRFRHDGDNPLPFDVVVVDEASMIDLPLMAKLVDAVASGTRLVLLGDPDQLPSVEAGDVLAAILGAAGEGDAMGRGDADVLRPLLGDADNTSVLAQEGGEARFPGIRVHLQRGWRQSEALDLAPLAAAVREGDADAALAQLRAGTLSNVHFHEGLADPLEPQRDALLAHFRALGHAATPADALAQSTRLRLLTAVREGPQGARTLNARIERLLAEGGGSGRAPQGHFQGQLLIVTENSYRHRLFNGDIGVCLRDAAGTLVAWFPGDDAGHPRAFHPAALPAHESAFAMTVHKAQGSEFDTVWLLLPARGNRVLSRELVYTGITRARRALHVAGSEAVIREALARHAGRWSGLGWRLGAR
ncbi:MAG: exodeoxyribonuclease V subunit alpha [Pseudoxanthomonas sp.]|jgi:exodeoxyribonuclease V alpha subunit|uniref:exodeoxyribonuclease V subunit alpha n=1 Tax=Pseudoxanthomonas TaxID=83618 RepID=UPI002586A52D|nr:exodeoxyribonuclease V subunit alpha [Pseudoxanthomonas sp.]MCH2092453.1 exodeoxyribonuclease V subunit alpha [Pseudoxanthomonas sp.]